MKAYTLRGIESKTYDKLKSECKKKGMSINKYLLECLENSLHIRSRKTENPQFEEFYGSWKESEYKKITREISRLRKIDKNVWK